MASATAPSPKTGALDAYIDGLDLPRPLAELAHEIVACADAREASRKWLDYVHSVAFREVVDDVYARCANANVSDGTLDVAELRLAADMLHERLNAMARGRLPKPRTDAATLMKKFDADASKSLDADEFHRFAMCYFSRLEWPIWRVFTRGAAIGFGAFIAHEVWINPLVQRFVQVMLPKIIAKVQKQLTREFTSGVATRWEKLRIKMSDGNLFGDSENEKRMLLRLERRKRRAEFFGRAKRWIIAAIVGGSGAAAGFL